MQSHTQNLTVISLECLLLFITFSTCFAFYTNNKVWRTCFVESGELVAGSDIRKEEFVAESLMECNFIANENKWSFLMCHKDKNCAITSQLFDPNFEPLGLTNSVKCFTALEKPRPKLDATNFIFEISYNYDDAVKACIDKKATPFVPKAKEEYNFLKSLVTLKDRNLWYPLVYYPDIEKVIYWDGTVMEDNPFNPPDEDVDPDRPKTAVEACTGIANNMKFVFTRCMLPDLITLVCLKGEA